MGHINGAEIAKHNTKKSCWIVLDSKAYDVTSFMSKHPGGAPIILKNAGTVSMRNAPDENALAEHM
jgi:L-lactate dehydrogenase (cytochrome)